jgi:uncharacterized Ntn-hydrolase superfamily protein
VKRIVLALVLLLGVHKAAFATWSIIVVDQATGQMVLASATCLQQGVFPSMGVKDLRDVQAVVVPGKGAAMCQAAIDSTKRNQQLVFDELQKGTAPSRILELLKARDPGFESRQYGILDLQGRSAGFSGAQNIATSLATSGTAGVNIHYQIQGNILANADVIHDAERALVRGTGSLADRVMSAMEAADAKGGDKRCGGGRTAYVAYLLVVEKNGQSKYLSVTNEDIKPAESINPVKTLRLRYDASKRK